LDHTTKHRQVRVRELTEKVRDLEDQLAAKDGELESARESAAAEQDRKVFTEMREREERLGRELAEARSSLKNLQVREGDQSQRLSLST
jgi:hypothetical protein